MTVINTGTSSLRHEVPGSEANGTLKGWREATQTPESTAVLHDPSLRWSWACRKLKIGEGYQLARDNAFPRAGDVVVTKIIHVGHHTRLTLSNNSRIPFYAEDHIVGVFGNRYATDAFEGEVNTTSNLHLLTGAGMVGTVKTKNTETKSPTRLQFLGYLTDPNGHRINLQECQFRPKQLDTPEQKVILVVGTGMNSGKTTTAVKLIKGLINRGGKVAACKVTGSVSERDRLAMKGTAAHDVRDFSDYGFPSTYRLPEQELIALFQTMVADACSINPDVVVMEIADGVLQKETQMLLNNDHIKSSVQGSLMAASCALSAIHGVELLKRWNHNLLAVSGRITSSPLCVREFTENCEVPVVSSVGLDNDLADIILSRVPFGS